jgi:hypothetical protein
VANTFNGELRRPRTTPLIGPARVPAAGAGSAGESPRPAEHGPGTASAPADPGRYFGEEPDPSGDTRDHANAHADDEDRAPFTAAEQGPSMENGPAQCAAGSQHGPLNPRRGIGNNLLTALTVAVLGSQHRRGWASTAVKIHEHVVQHYRDEAAWHAADTGDGEAAAPGT